MSFQHRNHCAGNWKGLNERFYRIVFKLSRPVGWSESGGGFFFKEVELPKADGLGAASGVQVGGQGAKPPEALKFKSHLKHIAA